MKKWTVRSIMNECPCSSWTKERVEDVFSKFGSEVLTTRDILGINSVSYADRIWVATRKNALSRSVLLAFSEMVVDRAVKKYVLKDQKLSVWAEAWISGSDRSKKSINRILRASGCYLCSPQTYTLASAKALLNRDFDYVAKYSASAAYAEGDPMLKMIKKGLYLEEMEYKRQVADLLNLTKD